MANKSPGSVYFAIVCDLAIALSKFLAGAFTGSSAMISEGIHSMADCSNGLLLLWGRKVSAKPADADHPFGHGKELYFWTLIVTILIFAGGGGMSIYEGIVRTLHPGGLKDARWNYFVLGVAAIFEGATVWTAGRDFRRAEGKKPFWSAIHATKDPTVATVLLENLAALVGLLWAFLGTFLSVSLKKPALDGIASVLIGLTLATMAVVLAVEVKSLLVGEAMDKNALAVIREIAGRESGIVSVGNPLTMYLGPDSVLLALDLEFDKNLSASEVTSTVDRIETAIRSRYPMVRRIFIEAESISRNAAHNDSPTVTGIPRELR